MGPKVLAVTQDANPSRGFEALAVVSGKNLKLMVGNGKPFPYDEDAIKEAVAEADAVLIGLSSSQSLAWPEIVAAKAAIAFQKPLYAYGDIVGCFNRKWFEGIAPSVAVYFGASDSDALAAKSVFYNATCYGFGNPLDDKMVFSRFTREEVRNRFEVLPDGVMVVAAGSKTVVENCFTWSNLIDILEHLRQRGHSASLVLAPHPADRSRTAMTADTKELLLYEEFIVRSPFPVSILGKDDFSSSDVLLGADLVVAFGGSIGREASIKGIPVLAIGTEIAFRRMEQESGSRVPEAVSLGLAHPVSDENSIKAAQVVGELLDPTSVVRRLMGKKQEEFRASLQNLGYAVKQMWQVIEAL